MLQTTDAYTEALATAVATRDLPRAAFCAKELLKRRAHTKLRTAIVTGFGEATDIDERYAQSVCEILLELRTCDITLAASALATCMKSVSTIKLSNMHANSTFLINADAVDKAMTKSGGDEDMAHLMAKTLGVIETATALARACARNGRDPAALKALSKCVFLKNKDMKAGAAKLLLACVRASRTKRSDIVKVCVNASLEAALKPDAKKTTKKDEDDDYCESGGVWKTDGNAGCEDSHVDKEMKMAIIWTCVPMRTDSMMAVEEACYAVEAPELKVISGFNVPEPMARVSMIHR